jgi:hypothetical protein
LDKYRNSLVYLDEVYRVAGSPENIFIIHGQKQAQISKTKWSSGKGDPYSRYIIETAPPNSCCVKYSKIDKYEKIYLASKFY